MLFSKICIPLNFASSSVHNYLPSIIFLLCTLEYWSENRIARFLEAPYMFESFYAWFFLNLGTPQIWSEEIVHHTHARGSQLHMHPTLYWAANQAFWLNPTVSQFRHSGSSNYQLSLWTRWTPPRGAKSSYFVNVIPLYACMMLVLFSCLSQTDKRTLILSWNWDMIEFMHFLEVRPIASPDWIGNENNLNILTHL